MSSLKEVVESKYTWGTVITAVLLTLCCQPRVQRQQSLAGLRAPTNSHQPSKPTKTVTPPAQGNLSLVAQVSPQATLESASNIALLNQTAAALSNVVARYNPGTPPEKVMEWFEEQGISNRLERIYHSYTNLIMSGGLTMAETNHVIGVLELRANTAVLFFNPQAPGLLLAPSIATTPNGGITSIADAAKGLFEASAWLLTQSSRSAEGR